MNKKSAYKEILEVLKKHKDILEGDHRINITGQVSDRIRIQEISEEFGIDIKPDATPDWCKLSEYIAIGFYGEDQRRTISWSDNGEQPDNERLLSICFPTGPYIFGGDYYIKTFKMFYDELSTYGPKYTDTNNKCLYFTSENAKSVNDNFSMIFKKYRDRVHEEAKEKQIAELEKQLSSLKTQVQP